MAKPLLNLGDIRLVIESVGGGRRAQRMNAKAIHLAIDASLAPVFANDVVVDGIRIEPAVELFGTIVRHRTEEGTGGIILVASER